LVRPRGNGIPLSEVYITNVLSAKPAECNSAKNTPTPAQQTQHSCKTVVGEAIDMATGQYNG